jgi:hypothetical protein
VTFTDPSAPVVATLVRSDSPQTDTTSADIPLGPSGSSVPTQQQAPSATAGSGSTGCGTGGSGQGSAKGGSAPGAAVLGTPLGAPLALDAAALTEPAAGSPSGLPDDPTFLPD